MLCIVYGEKYLSVRHICSAYMFRREILLCELCVKFNVRENKQLRVDYELSLIFLRSSGRAHGNFHAWKIPRARRRDAKRRRVLWREEISMRALAGSI